MKYGDFLTSKTFRFEPSGFDLTERELNPKLKPHQRAIVRWALRRGRAACFADTGLGKTVMQLEWAWNIFQRTGNRVLILTPLCVVEEFVKDADLLGYHVHTDREFKKDGRSGVYVTNYEMLPHYLEGIRDGYFDGICVDESSILKHYDSKTRNLIINTFRDITYKFSASATPAPNDYMELGNQAEFLGVMSMAEMLSMFFIHDSGETSKWRLKGHGERRFWEWLASWAVVIQKPSDLGFEDDGYILPGLEINEIVVPSHHSVEDNSTLSGRNEARRLSIDERVTAAAALMNADQDQWIAWCNLNDESAKLVASIAGAVEVKGSDKPTQKEERMRSFSAGKSRVMVTKPSIAGFGLNWQHCSKMVFVGLNDSYEQLYQAIRRCYRYGQSKVVTVYLVSSELEGAVRENILEKERKAQVMISQMVGHMRDFTRREVVSLESEKSEYHPKVDLQLPEFIQ